MATFAPKTKFRKALIQLTLGFYCPHSVKIHQKKKNNAKGFNIWGKILQK
jgi:hypothetical protein